MSKILSSTLSETSVIDTRYKIIHGEEYENIKLFSSRSYNNSYTTDSLSHKCDIDKLNAFNRTYIYHNTYLSFNENDKMVFIIFVNILNIHFTKKYKYSTYSVSGNIITIDVNEENNGYPYINEYLELSNCCSK
jgi:hypothetical protein